MDAKESLETFPKACLFLRTRVVSWLNLVVHRASTFTKNVLLLEFVTSFWNKLGTSCRSWSCEVLLALTYTIEGLWSYVLHRAEIMQRLSTNHAFVVCFLVCGSHRKGLKVWVALNKGGSGLCVATDKLWADLASRGDFTFAFLCLLSSLFQPQPVSSHNSCSHP